MSEPTLYEAAYILDASLPDEEAEQVIEVIEAATEEAGGEVVGTRDFRTRRLAYRIDNYTHGTYKLLYFFGTGATVEEVRSEMSIRQQIIRSRVFVANPRAIVGGLEDEEAEEAAEAAEEAAEAAEAEETAEAGEAEGVPEAEEAAEAEEVPGSEETGETAAEAERSAEEEPGDSDEAPEAEAEEEAEAAEAEVTQTEE